MENSQMGSYSVVDMGIKSDIYSKMRASELKKKKNFLSVMSNSSMGRSKVA